MEKNSDPIWVILPNDKSSKAEENYSNWLQTKIFVATLQRTLFSGSIIAFNGFNQPLFKVARKDVHEIPFLRTESPFAEDDVQTLTFKAANGENKLAKKWFVPKIIQEKPGTLEPENLPFYAELTENIRPLPDQWVILSNCSGIAFRNPDHLIPQAACGKFPPSIRELLWVEDSETKAPHGGFWAAKGHIFHKALGEWNRHFIRGNKDPIGLRLRLSWIDFIRSTKIKKGRIEKTEVIVPKADNFNWRSAKEAAVVSVSEWPSDKLDVLQALYFSHFFADTSGLMLKVLEP